MKYYLHKFNLKAKKYLLKPLALVLVSTSDTLKVPSWTLLAELAVGLYINKSKSIFIHLIIWMTGKLSKMWPAVLHGLVLSNHKRSTRAQQSSFRQGAAANERNNSKIILKNIDNWSSPSCCQSPHPPAAAWQTSAPWVVRSRLYLHSCSAVATDRQEGS